MFCRNCGKESDGVKKFCTNCGTSLVSEVPRASSSTPQPVIRPPMPKEPWTAGRITKTIVAVLFIGGIIGVRAINSVDSGAVSTNNNAMSAYDSGNSDQAISQFQDASKSAIGSETKITTLKNLAYVYSSEGKNELAIGSFKEALALTAGSSFDHYLISGEIDVLEGRSASAYENYNKAYAMNPEDFQINNALTLFHLDMESAHPQYEDYAKALLYAQKAAQLTPLEVAKQNLAIAYFFNKNYDQTISIMTGLKQNNDPHISYWIGLAYAQKDDPANAKIYLRRAVLGGVKVPQEVTDYLNSN